MVHSNALKTRLETLHAANLVLVEANQDFATYFSGANIFSAADMSQQVFKLPTPDPEIPHSNQVLQVELLQVPPERRHKTSPYRNNESTAVKVKFSPWSPHSSLHHSFSIPMERPLL